MESTLHFLSKVQHKRFVASETLPSERDLDCFQKLAPVLNEQKSRFELGGTFLERIPESSLQTEERLEEAQKGRRLIVLEFPMQNDLSIQFLGNPVEEFNCHASFLLLGLAPYPKEDFVLLGEVTVKDEVAVFRIEAIKLLL